MLFPSTLRYFGKKLLVGKRRFRYQTYDCAYFVETPRFEKKGLFSDSLL